jgi:ATP-dependent DNA helicase DinG
MQDDEIKFEYAQYFPYDKPRESQVESIQFALDQFINNDKRVVIIEAGTGVGKSAIGLTVARYLEKNMKQTEDFDSGAYFLTTQKILQEQYVKDFGTGTGIMKSLMSSTNYGCKYFVGQPCSEGQRALKTAEKGSRLFKTCVFNCTYKHAKESFIKSPEGVTNFPYFLAETTYAGKLKPRNVLVVDEAHNADSQLGKFVEVTVTERFSKDMLKLKMPDLKTQFQAFKWVQEVYAPKLFSHVKHAEKMMDKYINLREKLKEFAKLAKQHELLDKHACKIRRFMQLYDKDNWVFNLVPAYGRKSTRLEFKPIDVAPYSEDALLRLGRKIIMMTATILDKDGFCELLGLKKEDAAFISIPSPFPVKNRPIMAVPIGKMTKDELDASLPKLAQAVQEIMKHHPGEKGIIHCHTFKIANYLKKNIRSKRILLHNSDNREELLKKHLKSPEPTVLLSPSMTEGIDLRDDQGRFQVICKIPYPFLGDKLIRKRMNKWKWWYALQTTKTIVQAVGRSVRSNDDHAVTYVLDAGWDQFYQQNRNLFPKDFQACIR